MAKRRSRGDGTVYWHEDRQRWIGGITIGYDGRGKRIRKRVSGKTKTEVKDKLRSLQRQQDDGLLVANDRITVEVIVGDFLRHGLNGRSESTISNYSTICETCIVQSLGKLRLTEMTTRHVDEWLTDLSRGYSTRTLRLAHGLLNRSVRRAMARDLVMRNVVELADVPEGIPGRVSKSLSMAQAEAILSGCEQSPLYAYLVVSLLTGVRTEEIRALIWADTFLDEEADTPPHIAVVRSVRKGGDTKTRASKRGVALPGRCVEVLVRHKLDQARIRASAGSRWHDNDLVFASAVGTKLDAANVRRAFRSALSKIDGIDPSEWTPRELRHSFVSLLSDRRVPIEDISRLVGHSSSSTTERVYRKQLRPVVETGADVMNDIFGTNEP